MFMEIIRQTPSPLTPPLNGGDTIETISPQWRGVNSTHTIPGKDPYQYQINTNLFSTIRHYRLKNRYSA